MRNFFGTSLLVSSAFLSVACSGTTTGTGTAAASDSAADACRHINEVCADMRGFREQDCSQTNEQYEKLTPAEKERADKLVACVMGMKTCDGVTGCVTKSAATETSD
jgi:hypothetical protein